MPTKVHIVKAMVFPAVMYQCKRWTIKKAESQRINAFKLWCWRRLLRVLWTTRRSNQSILKEINPNIHWKDWCWSWSSNTVATWCKESTHWKRPCWWKKLTAGGEGDDREWDGWTASPIQWTWAWANSRRWWRTGKPGVLQPWGHKESDTTERLNNTMPMYGIQKDFTDEPVCRAGIETQIQRTDMWKWGERVGETNIGTAGLTHKLCVTQMASGNLLHNTGSSAWCSVVT